MLGLPIRADVKIPTVAARDIASVATRWLMADNWNGQEGIAVHGPEDLSGDDMAVILSEALSMPVKYKVLGADIYSSILKTHGATGAFAQGLTDMLAEVEQGIYQAEPRTPESTTPTTLFDWAAQVLKPLVEREA